MTKNEILFDIISHIFKQRGYNRDKYKSFFPITPTRVPIAGLIEDGFRLNIYEGRRARFTICLKESYNYLRSTGFSDFSAKEFKHILRRSYYYGSTKIKSNEMSFVVSHGIKKNPVREERKAYSVNKYEGLFLEEKEKAYELIRKKKILSKKDFYTRREFEPELEKIPRCPYSYYKNWSWLEATGKPKIKPHSYVSKEKAYEILKRENVLTDTKYRNERKINPILSNNIPCDPYSYYKTWSWNDIKDKSRSKFSLSKEEAYTLLKRKNILLEKDFWKRRKTDPELQKIPFTPYRIYKDWSWREAIIRKPPPFLETKEEAYELIQRKNISSIKDFFERRKTDPELKRIPVNPYQQYKEWNWNEAKGKLKPDSF